MPDSTEQTAARTTYFSLAGNVALAAIKGLAGYFGNSYALIADAIESTTDVFASLLVLIGLRYANRPADKNHPFGHGRIEPLVTFMVVGFLIVSAAVIAYQSIVNVRTPHDMPETWTLWVLGVIIIWKEMSFQWVRRMSVKTNSTSLRADAWHHRIDDHFTVKDAIDEGYWQSCGKEFAQRQRHNEVRFLAFGGHDLVRNGRPKNGEPASLDGDAVPAQQVSERAGLQKVEFNFVVLVRTRHARRRPQFARETVGAELGPGTVEAFHAH
jgi:hypothetical protein